MKLNTGELGTVLRLIAGFTADMSSEKDLTPLQISALDDMTVFLGRKDIINNLDRQQLFSIQSKINEYYKTQST
jgi:hypothetical protein